MKKILAALVMALTFTTGAFAQPAQELPSFLQDTQAVSMTDTQMSEVRGESEYLALRAVLKGLRNGVLVPYYFFKDIVSNSGRQLVKVYVKFFDWANGRNSTNGAYHYLLVRGYWD